MNPIKKMKVDRTKWEEENLCSCETFQSNYLSDSFLSIEYTLASKLFSLVYSHPVAYVYNPIEYAKEVHSLYVRRYCQSQKELMFLGMNPGPWGMSQTGVPFGEVNSVRGWMNLSGYVGRPERENPARPILGFECRRSEVSGQRFWSLFQELCGEAADFFRQVIVYNHCPLTFMTESGKNITPTELKLNERKAVNSLCDEALCRVIELFQVKIVVAIGRFAEKRILDCVKAKSICSVKILYIPHPSPRNFGSAGKWKETVIPLFQQMGLMHFFSSQKRNVEPKQEGASDTLSWDTKEECSSEYAVT